jgi:hypothetical protein
MGETQARVYLDTLAYLDVLLGEPAVAKILKLISKKILCSSVLLLIEAERNLVRLSREGILSNEAYDRVQRRLKQDRELFLLREITFDLCLTGAFPPVQIPKSNDLIHLRTARWFQDQGGLEVFITTDGRQGKAAGDFGLPVAEI